jgi:hypothetical protein
VIAIVLTSALARGTRRIGLARAHHPAGGGSLLAGLDVAIAFARD